MVLKRKPGPVPVASRRGVIAVAETAKGNKIVRVKGYTRADGRKVATHDRSTPDTSSGAKRRTTKKSARKSSR
jgi:hypothetical protein